MGTIMLVISALNPGSPGFGWGKPVPVDPRNLRWGRRGLAIVSAAGPLSNLFLGIVSATVLLVALKHGVSRASIWPPFLQSLMFLNIGLCAFNLLPVPPLDGFGVLIGILPWEIARRLTWLHQYGMGILLILVFSGSILRFSLLGLILGPPLAALQWVVITVGSWLALGIGQVV